MAVIWDKDRVSKLTLDELKKLLVNAEQANNAEVAQLVKDEIGSRRVRTTKVRDHDVPRTELENVAKSLLEKYDLSPEKAKELSSDIKGFVPHSLLGKNGKAKVGGSKKMGNCSIDEYISYRLRDEAYALCIIQLKTDPTDFYRYHVYGPPQYLENPVDIRNIRPDLRPDVMFNTFMKHGVEYLDFDGASALYQSMIDKVAPRR